MNPIEHIKGLLKYMVTIQTEQKRHRSTIPLLIPSRTMNIMIHSGVITYLHYVLDRMLGRPSNKKYVIENEVLVNKHVNRWTHSRVPITDVRNTLLQRYLRITHIHDRQFNTMDKRKRNNDNI